MATVGTLSADSMAAIGRELRLKYKEVIAEGMPERFAKILRRLDEPSNEGSKASRHRLINRTRIPCDEPHSSIFTKDRDSWRPCALGLRCSLSDIRTSSHSEFRANIDAHRGNGRD